MQLDFSNLYEKLRNTNKNGETNLLKGSVGFKYKYKCPYQFYYESCYVTGDISPVG